MKDAKTSGELGYQNGVYRLSDEQAQAILELRLHRLTALEKDKLFQEFKDVLGNIAEFQKILGDASILDGVIKQEFEEIKANYKAPRRTQILNESRSFSLQDIIAEAKIVITLTSDGYLKAQNVEDFSTQRRGGKGQDVLVFERKRCGYQLFVLFKFRFDFVFFR